MVTALEAKPVSFRLTSPAARAMARGLSIKHESIR